MHTRRLVFSLSLGLTLGLQALASQPVAAQRVPGYQIVGDHIVVDRAAHWRGWTLPTHAVDLTPDGRVAPHFFRRRYNLLDDRLTFARGLDELKRSKKEHAILNIDSLVALDVHGNTITVKKSGQQVPLYRYQLRMGISRVGSNAGTAPAILDGDPTTWWEPDLTASPNDWWIEIDLGRVVAVDSLVVHFVEPELGDPFRQFRVLVAPNQDPVLEDAKRVGFGLAARTTAPNVDKRVFSFDFDQSRATPGWTGGMIETIRLVVTDSRIGRGFEIDEVEWEALDPADRGDIVYFIRGLEGFEEPKSREVYESVPAERQGRREFYRRERPRLADIEVWGYGDNIGLGMVEGGGNVTLSGGGFSPAAGFDGDYDTHFVHTIREKTGTADRGLLTIDLGATFWLDAMRISTQALLAGYLVNSSDGTREASGQLAWHRLSDPAREEIASELSSTQHFFDAYDSSPILRYLQMITFRHGILGYYQGPRITEYQFFSHGYPAEVVLTSDLIEVPAGRMLGAISWEADAPAGTDVEIRTRTGDLRRKVISFYDRSGSEVSQKGWNNLLGSFRGPVDTTLIVGGDWSTWSRLYEEPGVPVTSPSQRSFLQAQVKLRTRDRFTAPSIRSLDIELLEPNAERLLGEIWPVSVSTPGREDTFEVFLRPFFVESPALLRSNGFDELRLSLSGGSVDLIGIGVDVAEDTGEPAREFRRRDEGFVSADGASLEVFDDGPTALRVRFPEPVHSLPSARGGRLYHRIAIEQDQVPVGRDGELLTLASYGLLASEERGDQRFFRREVNLVTGVERLISVSESVYDSLDASSRAARFFRILADEGGQFPFDADGDTLDQGGYLALAAAERGRIVGPGSLMRVSFVSSVFVNGATLEMAVRNTASGTDPDAFWQGVPAGDATSLVASEVLSIQLPLDVRSVDHIEIAPNPFTPNGDGVNDAVRIRFSVAGLSTPREASVRIYGLDGRRVWQRRQMVGSGRAEVGWEGTDEADRLVPPGIYICQIELDVDAESASAARVSRLVHVAY